MELALGVLINAMNPYSNPACEHVNRVAGRMQAVVSRQPAGAAADWAQLVAELDPEIDNYQGSEWSFMGQMYKIKRGLLIPYRYEVRNQYGAGSGVMATGKLLVGYTGANGG